MQVDDRRVSCGKANQQAEWLAEHLFQLVMNSPAEWAANDLTLHQLIALEFISARSPISLANLSEQLGIQSPATSALVDRLMTAGLVCRTRDPEDRRRIRIDATGKAKAMIGSIDLDTARHMQAMLSSMSASNRRHVHQAISEAARHLTRHPFALDPDDDGLSG